MYNLKLVKMLSNTFYRFILSPMHNMMDLIKFLRHMYEPLHLELLFLC